jgi:hypothetical protein
MHLSSTQKQLGFPSQRLQDPQLHVSLLIWTDRVSRKHWRLSMQLNVPTHPATFPEIHGLDPLNDFFAKYASLVLSLKPNLWTDSFEEIEQKDEVRSRELKEFISQFCDRLLPNDDSGFFLAIFKTSIFTDGFLKEQQ